MHGPGPRSQVAFTDPNFQFALWLIRIGNEKSQSLNIMLPFLFLLFNPLDRN